MKETLNDEELEEVTKLFNPKEKQKSNQTSPFKLDENIEREGKNTWGCTGGWLEVEDVKEFIRIFEIDLKELDERGDLTFNEVIYRLRKRVGGKLT